MNYADIVDDFARRKSRKNVMMCIHIKCISILFNRITSVL